MDELLRQVQSELKAEAMPFIVYGNGFEYDKALLAIFQFRNDSAIPFVNRMKQELPFAIHLWAITDEDSLDIGDPDWKWCYYHFFVPGGIWAPLVLWELMNLCSTNNLIMLSKETISSSTKIFDGDGIHVAVGVRFAPGREADVTFILDFLQGTHPDYEFFVMYQQ